MSSYSPIENEWGLEDKGRLPFCLGTFLTVIAACLFWFSEISKPKKEKK
jgi:hypothetical protein